jgi:serine/threonine-protein kinase
LPAMSKKQHTIVLHGQNADYRFNPRSSKSQLRKVSKFSRVYKGESSDGKPVVIKMLPSDLSKNAATVQQFRNEINWYGLHPNLLAPFEYIFQDGRHFLIADYVRSIDLGFYLRYVRTFKKTRIKLAITCGLQLLDALEAIHNLGYLHGDIKPANVLLQTRRMRFINLKQPHFQLIDFGMVHKCGELSQTLNERTRRPFVLVYSPPENVLGFDDLVGYHSDLYHVALLIYEMITKEPPYASRLSVMIMNLQTSFPLPERKVIPKPLMDVLSKAASKHHFKKPPNHYPKKEVYQKLSDAIANRYHTVHEFRQALLDFRNSYFT